MFRLNTSWDLISEGLHFRDEFVRFSKETDIHDFDPNFLGSAFGQHVIQVLPELRRSGYRESDKIKIIRQFTT